MSASKIKRIQFHINFELPFWINLRNGRYGFKHFNYLKQELEPQRIKLLEKTADIIDYTLIIDNFLWKIGFDHLNDALNDKYKPILISENLDEGYII